MTQVSAKYIQLNFWATKVDRLSVRESSCQKAYVKSVTLCTRISRSSDKWDHHWLW